MRTCVFAFALMESRQSLSNNCGLSDTLVVVCVRRGSLSIRSESMLGRLCAMVFVAMSVIGVSGNEQSSADIQRMPRTCISSDIPHPFHCAAVCNHFKSAGSSNRLPGLHRATARSAVGLHWISGPTVSEASWWSAAVEPQRSVTLAGHKV